MATAQNRSPGRGEESHRPFPLNTGRSINRRKFFLLTGVLSGAGVAIYASRTLGIKQLINSRRIPMLDRDAPLGRLSEQEMETMIALLEILLPVTLWPGRENMVNMVNHATENVKGILKEYRNGLALLDQTAREYGTSISFATARLEVRQRILESLIWKYSGGKPGTLSYYVAKVYRGLDRFFRSEPQRRFRELVARDLLRRFYTGSVAWKMVGYARYPGMPGDPREYVHPRKIEQ